MEIPGRAGPEECSAWWSQLPNDLKQNALAWLPAERLCRYCGVCSEWNALFSSTQFINNDWVAAPPNKKPWLLLFHGFRSLSCIVYCLFTGTWKKLSLAFLKNHYDVDEICVEGSARGLFLATVHSYDIKSYFNIVCNPLTGKSIELPTIDDGDIWGMTIMAEEGHGHNGDKYKVIAMVNSAQAQRVEIYDSSLKSWSTAGHLPPNLRALSTIGTNKAVASGDFLYWKCVDVNYSRWGIVAFSIEKGTSLFTPLPLQDVHKWHVFGNLFTWGSRVLLGSCIMDSGAVIISEIENAKMDSRTSMVRVREIARMPPSIMDSDGRDAVFDFRGMGDLVCMRARRGFANFANEMLVYNLRQNTWAWLPRCPMLERWHGTPNFFGFEPRLDMNV